MPSKEGGEGGEATRVDVDERVSSSWSNGEVGRDDGLMKAGEDIGARARGKGAEEVTEARVDAVAEENVALIRRITIRAGVRVTTKKETVKHGDETEGAI